VLAEENVAVIDPAIDDIPGNGIDGASAAFAMLTIRHYIEFGLVQ
jgi:hypothetical protein